MSTIKHSFLMCILIAAILCVAQVIGSMQLLTICFAAHLMLTLFAAARRIAVPVMMFFLPWSPLLKYVPGSTTFFSIALLLVAAYYVYKNRFAFKPYQIVAPVLLIALTLVSKLIDGYMPSAEYLMFIVLLVLFPFASHENDNEYYFEILTLFFSAGIIMAAISARWLTAYPNISKYIDVYVFRSITRYSGFYGDANFYSAQISAAISGVLMIIAKEKNVKKMALLAIVGVMLLYCGLISASKSFSIVIVLTVMIWLLSVMTSKHNNTAKVFAIAGLAAVIVLMLSVPAFKEALAVIKTRFNQSNNFSDFTTGRTKRWAVYVELLTTDLKVLLMGVGFTDIKVNGWAPHNTIIQLVFQFGVIGTMLVMWWDVRFAQNVSRNYRIWGREVLEFAVVICGAILPWMALDILFFDEFFIIQLYAYSAVPYIKNHSSYSQLQA